MATVRSSVLLALSILVSARGQEDCGFYYLAQPPNQLPCNPYLSTLRFSLRIECIVAVDRSIGGDDTDFGISWFAQLGSESTPEEVLFNDSSSFSVRLDQSDITTSLYVYQSQVRLTDMDFSLFDRFWCQISVADALRDTLNITTPERSEQTILSDITYYTSFGLPFCPQQAFFHQTNFRCADFSENDTETEPPAMTSSAVPPIPSPASCPPSIVGEDNAQTSRLMSVLLPSLVLPLVVAILLVIAAVILTCGRKRKQGRDRKRKVTEAAPVENLTDPAITAPAPSAKEPDTTSPKETNTENRAPPMRPPPPTLRPTIQSPINTTPPTEPGTRGPLSNRFSQYIYEDIADSALESYSMSNNKVYSGNHPDVPSMGGERYPEIFLHLNGQASKRDERSTSHYKNAALISISDRSTPSLVSKKTAASLPSLIDPKHYHNPLSPKKRANEAPGAIKSLQKNGGDLYDTLAQKKSSSPTYYYNQGSSTALLVEDNEPDYDEVYEEEDSLAELRVRGGSDGRSTGGRKHHHHNVPFVVDKYLNAPRQQNAVSVVSESYEDMSGMEDFIESYKSSIAGTTL